MGKRERERETGGEGLRREEDKDGATGGADAALLLHAAAVVAQDFAFLAQVLRVLLALVGDVQAVRLLQRSLRKKTDRDALRGAHSRVIVLSSFFWGLESVADSICQRLDALKSPEWKELERFQNHLHSGLGCCLSSFHLWELKIAKLFGNDEHAPMWCGVRIRHKEMCFGSRGFGDRSG